MVSSHFGGDGFAASLLAAIILISAECLILAQINYAIINHTFSNVADMHVEGYVDIALCLAFILASFLYKLGAEQRQHAID